MPKINNNNFYIGYNSFLFLLYLFICNGGKNIENQGPISIKLITSVHKDLPFEFKTNKRILYY